MKKILIYICLLFMSFGLVGCDLIEKPNPEQPEDNPGENQTPEDPEEKPNPDETNPEDPEGPEQPEEPVKIGFSDIKTIIEGNLGLYKTRGTVIAVSTQSFLVKDNTGIILVDRPTTWLSDVERGTLLEIEGQTTLQKKAVVFNKEAQYVHLGLNDNIKETEQVLTADLANEIIKEEKVQPKLVTLTGTLTVSGNYFNISLKENNEITISISNPLKVSELKAANAQELELNGYIISVTGNKILNLLLNDFKVIPAPEPEPEPDPEVPGGQDKPSNPDTPVNPPVSGDTFQSTLSYYGSAKGKSGAELKLALRTIITSTHKKTTTYAELKTYLQNADEDPNNPKNMLLFYTGASVAKTDNMNIWNREHVWAQSLTGGWFGTSGAGADMHHLRPCNPSVNSSRGNKKFGTASGYYDASKNGADYRGDVARILFYLFTRYTQADKFNFTAIAQSKELLLEWNRIDPVSETEIIRNEYTQKIQGNRNPFIDHPEAADLIWSTTMLNCNQEVSYTNKIIVVITKKEENIFI